MTTTKTKEKGTKKIKLLKFILLIILYAIISIVLIYVPWCYFTKHTFGFFIEILTNKTYILSTVCIFLILCATTIFISIRYSLFGFNKIINRVDRATSSDVFGNSKWLTEKEMREKYNYYDFLKLAEIETAGYVVKSGLIKNKLMLSVVSKQHCLVVGTTRTGKSAYYLANTIQMNGHSKTKTSMVINDLKGELYEAHSLMLENQGYDVIKIDLRNPHTSHRYNPLTIVWKLYHNFNENPSQLELIDRASVYINEVAAILCPEGKGEQAQWSKGAQSIIKAIIWAMLEDSLIPEFGFTEDMFTILQISNITNRQRPFLEKFLLTRARTSPVFDYAGMILNNLSEKTVSSYFSTLSTALEGFLESGLQKITSATDIDISNIGSKPTALFIVIPDELKTRNIVGTMIISQIYNYLIFEASQSSSGKLKKDVYFLLDEFGNLPAIPNFSQWVALAAGRGIFFNLIIQADSQLEEIYGKPAAKTIMQNCHLQMLLGANEIETLKRFEDLFGKYTIYQRSASIDKSVNTEYKGSTSLTSKELVTLDQLQRMEMGTAFFKILGEFPCKTVFVPIFDKKIKNIITRGSVDRKLEGIVLDKEKTFYDLSIREALILSELSDSKAPQKPSSDGGYEKNFVCDEETLDIKTKKNNDKRINLLTK